MKATDLLAELRPPLDTTPDDGPTLEQILLAGPAPAPSRTSRYRRPLVAVGVTAIAATGVIALVPSSDSGPVGLARAAAQLAQPGVLLHFTASTTRTGGATTSTETWQTPDGRLWREIDSGHGHGESESAYDQAGGTLENYVKERNEILVETKQNYPETFEDRPDRFGTITDGSSESRVGDLPALLRLAVDGSDPDVRHVGRTTVRGVDVDQIQVKVRHQFADFPGSDGPATDSPPPWTPKEWRDAPTKTITIVRDIYVRHDDALPVRVVEQPSEYPGFPGFTTDYDDVQKLALDASTRPLLKIDRPGATRTVEPPFDDSRADAALGD